MDEYGFEVGEIVLFGDDGIRAFPHYAGVSFRVERITDDYLIVRRADGGRFSNGTSVTGFYHDRFAKNKFKEMVREALMAGEQNG